MTKKLVSRAEFARRAGVSGAAVTKACDSILKDALEGKRIDLAHPLAASYIESKAKKQTQVVTEEPKKKPHARGHVVAKEAKKTGAPQEAEWGGIDGSQHISSLLDNTLREILDEFGTDIRFVDWLSAAQKIEVINEKRLKNAQTEGHLITRDLVKRGVIDTFNAAHLRLMKDGAKSIAAGVISKHAGGAELSEVEAYVSDILGSFIKPVKGKIARVLKNG